MSNIVNFFNFFKPKRQKPPSIEERVSWLVKPYASIMQDIILWKTPRLSVIFLCGVNLIFWLMRVCEIRPLGFFACLVLFAIILDAVATALGAGRRPNRERLPKSSKQTSDQFHQLVTRARQWLSVAYVEMLQLRESNPTKFCVVTSGSLGILYFIGRATGSFLWHIIITITLLLPLGSNLKTVLTVQSQDSDAEVDEFLPVMSQNALEELHRAGEILTETNEPTSFMSTDISLTNDANIALSYAAGEIESSEEEDDEKVNLINMQKRSSSPSPSLPSTDSSDNDEFVLQEPEKIMLLDSLNTPKPNKGINVPSTTSTTWFSSILKTPWSGSKPAEESDSDEFELIDKNDL